MSHTRQTCPISLGLTIMDRCPDCEKIDRAAEETERIERNRAFAARWSTDHVEPKSTTAAYDTEMAERRRSASEQSAKTPACGCDKPHAEGTQFFVGCFEDSGERRHALLLGPYSTHEEALANVDRGRKLAIEIDPGAYWHSFGTCSIHGPTEQKGVFGK